MAPSGRTPVNASATHIFDILRLVSKSDSPLGVSEISRLTGLPVSTVHRALATLEQSQYIARLESAPRYKLGPTPQFLTRAIFQKFALRSASIPFLKRIAHETGETVTLCVRVGFYVLRIAVAYGRNDLYSPGRLGEVTLLQNSLAGRSLINRLSSADLEAYRSFLLDHYPDLARCSSDKGADPQCPYHRESMAEQPDRIAVAFPVKDHLGSAIASIVIADAERSKANEQWIERCLDQLRELEALIACEPTKYRSPYTHIESSTFVLK